MNNSGMYVGGLVLAGVGGWMLGWGLGSTRETICTPSGRVVICEEYGENKTL